MPVSSTWLAAAAPALDAAPSNGAAVRWLASEAPYITSPMASILRCIFEEIDHLPRQRTEIIGQRNADRITPCGAARDEIDLVGRWVGNAGNATASVKCLPDVDKSCDRAGGVCSCCRAKNRVRGRRSKCSVTRDCVRH